MTVIYEITATVRDDLMESYERYMSSKHIPDLMSTGCFVGATFSRSEIARYRIWYTAASQDDLDRYLNQNASRLRDDLRSHFPNGVEPSREVWNMIEEF